VHPPLQVLKTPVGAQAVEDRIGLEREGARIRHLKGSVEPLKRLIVVRSRSVKFQPYFDSGFPYGHDQWISAAGTNWAALAITLSVNHSLSLSRTLR